MDGESEKDFNAICRKVLRGYEKLTNVYLREIADLNGIGEQFRFYCQLSYEAPETDSDSIDSVVGTEQETTEESSQETKHTEPVTDYNLDLVAESPSEILASDDNGEPIEKASFLVNIHVESEHIDGNREKIGDRSMEIVKILDRNLLELDAFLCPLSQTVIDGSDRTLSDHGCYVDKQKNLLTQYRAQARTPVESEERLKKFDHSANEVAHYLYRKFKSNIVPAIAKSYPSRLVEIGNKLKAKMNKGLRVASKTKPKKTIGSFDPIEFCIATQEIEIGPENIDTAVIKNGKKVKPVIPDTTFEVSFELKLVSPLIDLDMDPRYLSDRSRYIAQIDSGISQSLFGVEHPNCGTEHHGDSDKFTFRHAIEINPVPDNEQGLLRAISKLIDGSRVDLFLNLLRDIYEGKIARDYPEQKSAVLKKSAENQTKPSAQQKQKSGSGKPARDSAKDKTTESESRHLAVAKESSETKVPAVAAELKPPSADPGKSKSETPNHVDEVTQAPIAESDTVVGVQVDQDTVAGEASAINNVDDIENNRAAPALPEAKEIADDLHERDPGATGSDGQPSESTAPLSASTSHAVTKGNSEDPVHPAAGCTDDDPFSWMDNGGLDCENF